VNIEKTVVDSSTEMKELPRTHVDSTSHSGTSSLFELAACLVMVGVGAVPLAEVYPDTNVEMGTTVDVGSRIKVLSWVGCSIDGLGFGGTLDKAGPSVGQNSMYTCAVWDSEERV
jgi:hypothetical protein